MGVNLQQPFHCQYLGNCSGCSTNPEVSTQRKANTHQVRILSGLPTQTSPVINTLSIADSGLRDRADLIWDKGSLGLFDQTRKHIVDLESCPQLSPALQSWLKNFRRWQWPIERGSLRLRLGPQGQKGLWLDFANVDVKKILTEFSAELIALMDKGVTIEIGQRHKRLVKAPDSDKALKLTDPTLGNWNQSLFAGNPVSLYSSIASFSQAGHQANAVILKEVARLFQNYPGARVLEFGSGNGNLSFPALEQNRKLLACEFSEIASMGLRQSLLEQNLADRAEVLTGDFQQKKSVDFKHFDVLLANPPRSGLMKFLDPLVNTTGPSAVIYMSCYQESFIKDAQVFQTKGFQLQELCFIDQFPQSEHLEILSWWQR